MARAPLRGLGTVFSYAYYQFTYRYIFAKDGFYWWRLIWEYPFYGFCFLVSAVADWAIV